MKSLLTSIPCVILLAAFGLTAPRAQADSVQIYQVTGTMTFGSVETVNFSFEHSCTIEAPVNGVTLCGGGSLVPGTATATATGAFSFTNLVGYLGPGYVGFNPPSDISQFYVNVGADFFSYDVPPSGSLQLLASQSNIWSCLSQACINAFGLQGIASVGQFGPVEQGSLVYTASLLPEPSSLALLGLGLGATSLLLAARKRPLLLRYKNWQAIRKPFIAGVAH